MFSTNIHRRFEPGDDLLTGVILRDPGAALISLTAATHKKNKVLFLMTFSLTGLLTSTVAQAGAEQGATGIGFDLRLGLWT